MKIRLFDIHMSVHQDGKQVWPPARPKAPPPAPLTAAARWLLGFALAVLVVAVIAFMA